MGAHWAAGLAGLGLAASCAALEANDANVADLDSLRGVGPALSARILAARAEQRFDGWSDLLARVPGLGPQAAARLSAQGLTVNGQPYAAAATAPPGPRQPGASARRER